MKLHFCSEAQVRALASAFFESPWCTNKQMRDKECPVIVQGLSGIWSIVILAV
jgi:hypothetical protein